jgi:hypothetical protein
VGKECPLTGKITIIGPFQLAFSIDYNSDIVIMAVLNVRHSKQKSDFPDAVSVLVMCRLQLKAISQP